MKKKKADEKEILRGLILEEHSKRQTMRVVKWIDNDPERFNILMELFLANEYRVTQRASAVVSHATDANPALIKPHLAHIIHNLSKPNQHDAVIRNTVRILQFIPVPKKLQGELVDTCFHLLRNPESPIAVQAFSMTVLVNIAREEPDLKNEIRLVIEDLIPYGSPGVKNRAKKMLAELNKL